jgi:hypothetical protein
MAAATNELARLERNAAIVTPSRWRKTEEQWGVAEYRAATAAA